MNSDVERTKLAKFPTAPATAGYVHTQTFFQHNRWSMHDKVGELLANGITQISMVKLGADWQLSWLAHAPPNVVENAKQTDPA